MDKITLLTMQVAETRSYNYIKREKHIRIKSLAAFIRAYFRILINFGNTKNIKKQMLNLLSLEFLI